MVTLAIATGLRCSELFALKWCDFDWLGGAMYVRRAIVDGVVDDVKTRYSKSKLPLHPSLADMLLRWKDRTEFDGEDDFVFASWRTLGKLPFRSAAGLMKSSSTAVGRGGAGASRLAHVSPFVFDPATSQRNRHQDAAIVNASCRCQNNDESLYRRLTGSDASSP